MFRKKKNTAEVNLNGLPASLLRHLKSYEDYKNELGETIDKISNLFEKYGTNFKKEEMPEELKQAFTRSSELVLLNEFTKQFDILRK